jgi:hypothetical protein
VLATYKSHFVDAEVDAAAFLCQPFFEESSDCMKRFTVSKPLQVAALEATDLSSCFPAHQDVHVHEGQARNAP